ncbi:hypothetical protein [Planosporangium mesophilum]|uniref:Bacterial Pleckstrin homology domain-containing protein n=1 Tax=Planosporangium mesophilum TaxID=689768 RepID=A0A8J3TET7_9ACTN|nr:hypothetical protein [Planosporangium mesophilum]NJC86775.1 hypothetical protein [Planosporangium mesophilum]GII25825.1 hypothetical protein Pme01_54220 [Planosporangium mesophilum]
MTEIVLTQDSVRVQLTAVEKVVTIHGDVSVPRSAIRGVEIVEDALAATRGLRVGLGLPGVRKLGTWHRRSGKEFVDVRQGQPAVRVLLSGDDFSALLLGTDDPQSLAAALAPETA